MTQHRAEQSTDGARQAQDAEPSTPETPDPEVFAQQLNIRFKPRRVNQARRLAASRDETIQEFFDRLVLHEVKREQKRLMKELAAEEQRVKSERAALLADINS